MKFLFKNLRRKKEDLQPAALSQTRLAGFINRLKRRLADWMFRQTSGISVQRWKVIVISFIILTTSFSASKIFTAFSGKSTSTFVVEPIRKPHHISKLTDSRRQFKQAPDSTYLRIMNFGAYMDSLKTSESGKPIYDSITRLRPGLMDSIRLIKEQYQSQKNDQDGK